MSLRMITKAKGRTLARVHCAQLYMCKGTDLYDKPYGLIPAGSKTGNASVILDNTSLKVWITAGQIYCYGRQIIIDKYTEVVDLSTITFSSEKVYGTIYVRVDLNDVVDQTATLGFVYQSDAHVDFSEDMRQDNLYKRANGIFDIPIERFVYEPSATSGVYFSKQESLIRTLEEQARAKTEKVTFKIGNSNIEKVFNSKGKGIAKAINADVAGAADGLADTDISRTLDGVWTAMRYNILYTYSFIFNLNNITEKQMSIDFSRLQYAHIWIRHILKTSDNLLKKLQITIPLQYKQEIYDTYEDYMDLSFEFAFDFDISNKASKNYLCFEFEHTYPIKTSTAKIVVVSDSKFDSSKHIKIACFEFSPTSKKVKMTGYLQDTTTFTGKHMDEEQGVLRDCYFRFSKPTFIAGIYNDSGIIGASSAISDFAVYADFIYKGNVKAS